MFFHSINPFIINVLSIIKQLNKQRRGMEHTHNRMEESSMGGYNRILAIIRFWGLKSMCVCAKDVVRSILFSDIDLDRLSATSFSTRTIPRTTKIDSMVSRIEFPSFLGHYFGGIFNISRTRYHNMLIYPIASRLSWNTKRTSSVASQ